MTKTFFPKYGFLPIFITICITLILGSITGITFVNGNGLWMLTGFFWLILYLILLLQMPIRFELNAQGLVIHRIVSKRPIPWNYLNKLRAVKGYFSFYTPSSLLAFNTRGFGGFLGKTSNGHISYATDTRNNVWLELKDGQRILISVKDPEGFLAAVKALR